MTEVQTTPKERPILFSAQMIRAILDGRKTQTRRLLESDDYSRYYFPFEGDFDDDGCPMACWRSSGCLTRIRCPFGVPGDRLWVRETFRPAGDDVFSSRVLYEATPDMGHRWIARKSADLPSWWTTGRKMPGIHMPRWCSRIDRDVVHIQVERLQDITDDDIRAEGVATECAYAGRCNSSRCVEHAHSFSAGTFHVGTRDDFERLWNKIHGCDAWAANPWVWAVAFRP